MFIIHEMQSRRTLRLLWFAGAATLAANLVTTADDMDAALERIVGIEGIQGVLIVKDDRVGLAGRMPQLVPAAR